MTKAARAVSSQPQSPFPERCNIHVYCAVQDRSKAKDADFTLLLVMARWADDAGICWPSVPSLAQCCHVSERAVQATIKRLMAMGELELLERGGGTSTNKFRICCVTGAVKQPAPVKPTAPVKSSVITGEVQRQRPVKWTSPKEPKEKNQEEPSSSRPGPDDDEKRIRAISHEFRIPREQAAAAFYVAIARHCSAGATPAPIRSVKFFADAVQEIQAKWPLPAGYADYLRQKSMEARKHLRDRKLWPAEQPPAADARGQPPPAAKAKAAAQ
jgi:hypothetical protein